MTAPCWRIGLVPGPLPESLRRMNPREIGRWLRCRWGAVLWGFKEATSRDELLGGLASPCTQQGLRKTQAVSHCPIQRL
jgi:hypothetical protein